ncbi:uncharacterized protein [Nicotiana tomentosiformis]|uniref:uncharacterized protein n=1 Tax=Nicotiana tomentosiformis TaxID=4098 RepID=UPI00388CA08D
MGHRHPGFSWNSPSGSLNSWQQSNSTPQGNEAQGFQNQLRQQYQPPQSNQSSMENLIKAFIIKTRTLPADTERNTKETINAVSLRSGYELEDPIAKQKDEPIERHVKIVDQQKNNNIQGGEVMVHVNIPFTEVISQMPAYAKFVKEILSKKQKVEETSVVKLTEHCTSINLMPLSIYRKLEGEIGEIRSIPVSLQLVDQTTIIPNRIIEDVLVRVDKFVFHVEFIMVNIEENRKVPMILERPVLATGRAILDIQERQLMLRVGDERFIFKMEGEEGALKEKIGKSEVDKCGVYPKKTKKKLSAWMYALGRVCKGDLDFDSDPD